MISLISGNCSLINCPSRFELNISVFSNVNNPLEVGRCIVSLKKIAFHRPHH